MKLKWYGTATILLEHDGTSLLFDPFFPLNDKVFQPDAEELSAVDNILVTHGHLDHITGIPVIMKHDNGKPTVYCTSTPRNTLISKDIDKERVKEIKPGDVFRFGQLEVRVLKGKHISFNAGLVLKTLLNPRVLTYRSNLSYLLNENKICIEAGETVVYDISIPGKRILLMGSLNLDDDTEYPKSVDLLILPFQGRSNLGKYAMTFIDRLQPKKVLLTHYDDTFPPISSAVKTESFVTLMQKKYPNIPVVRLQAGMDWIQVTGT